MNRISRSIAWAGAAPIALAAIIGGGVVFAYQANDSDTTSNDITTQQEPATPAPTDTDKAPTTTPEGTTPSEKDCANKGMRGGSGTTDDSADDASPAGMTFRSRH